MNNELCPICKNEMNISGRKEGISELGLSIKKPIYTCSKCGKKFEECDLCGGTGYYSKRVDAIFEADYCDCEVCHGNGYVEVKN